MRLKTVTRISFFVGLLTSSALNPDPALAQPTQAAARQSPPQRIHPQPNLTHAGVQYKPAFAEDVASVVRCLEGPIPKRVVELGEETTLRDLHYALAESLPIQVMIDTRAIDERGLDSGQTLKFEQPRDQMTVAAYLDRVLNPHDLIAIAIDGTLSITSEEESYNKQVVAHYPFPTTIADGPDMVRLVDTIQSVVPCYSSGCCYAGNGRMQACLTPNGSSVFDTGLARPCGRGSQSDRECARPALEAFEGVLIPQRFRYPPSNPRQRVMEVRI